MSKELFVHNEISLNADAATVWDILTKPEHTQKYMYGISINSDWKVGSPVLWKMTIDSNELVVVKGDVVKIEPEKYLEYTVFDPNMGIEDKASNYLTVTYTLTSEGSKTKLSISQGDFAGVGNTLARYDDTVKGWEHALQGIKEIVEG